MNCPLCHNKTKIVDSRSSDNETIRIHACTSCKYRFKTYEKVPSNALHKFKGAKDMRVVYIKDRNSKPIITGIPNDYYALEDLLGGYVTELHPFALPTTVALVSDSCERNKKPLNRVLPNRIALYGPIIICKGCYGDYVSIQEDEAENIIKLLNANN